MYWPLSCPPTPSSTPWSSPTARRVIIDPPPDARTGVSRARSTRFNDAGTFEGPTQRLPLGTVCGARSGDKGGNANVGVWTRSDDAYAWLDAYLTVERFRELVPEAATLDVERYELANLRALNFVVMGILGDGVASSVRYDPQAKGLGEYVRARTVDIPVGLGAGEDALRPGS